MPVVSVDQFGGLNTADGLDTGGALAATDVDFEEAGVLKNRPGRAYWTSDDAGTGFGTGYIAYANDSDPYVLVGTATHLLAYGVSSPSMTTFAQSNIIDIVSMGTSTSNYRAYMTDGSSVIRWNGSTLTAVAGAPAGHFLAVQRLDDRLVVANRDSSKVSFSDAGAPETFGANNYVYLTPGDGESITGVKSFGDSTIVLKQTKGYLFYGNSTDGTGQPVFNFRVFDLGDHIPAPTSDFGMVCADSDGVYFPARNGVYVTTGSRPVLLSRQIDKIVGGDYSTYPFNFGSNGVDFTMASDGRKLYVSQGNTHTLVYDKVAKQWAAYGFATTALCPTGGHREMWVFNGSNGRLAKMKPATTTDLGSTLTGTYQAAYASLGSSSIKKLREVLYEGSWSSMTSAVSSDLGSFDTPKTLLAATDLRARRDQRARRGRAFSWKVAGSGAWTLTKVGFNVQSVQGRS